MERKEFLKKLGLASVIVPIFTHCKDDDPTEDVVTPGACDATKTETH